MDEMMDGYMDGLKDERVKLPDSLGNRSDAYIHGWLNGRDDRTGEPRASAAQIRAQNPYRKGSI